MARRVYTLREPYKDGISGHITTGVSGEGVNVHDLLAEGDGEIVTDDPVFQSVLENYHGADGLVFDVQVVGDDDVRTPVPTETAPLPPIPVSPASTPSPVVAGTTAAAVPDAQHGEESESEYVNMPMHELREIASERNLELSGNIKKGELVEVLEADDAARAANPS